MLIATSEERPMSRELLVQCPDGADENRSTHRGTPVHRPLQRRRTLLSEDAGLSRQHFAFEPDGEEWTVQDLGSKNGTFVNNIALKARLILKPGDRVTAGHLVIVYAPDAADPAGVVVFEGETSSPTTSTVVTSLEGAQTMAVERGGPKASAPMQALIRAGQELSDNRPLNELFPVMLDLAIQAVSAQRGVLMILEGDQLVPKAHKGDGFRISTAVRDRVIKERSSILVRDAQLDDAFKGRMSIVEQKVHTMMAAPLQTKDRIIGLIYLDSPFILREFTKDDLSLLTVMANVAAIRIENARLAEVEQAERIMARDLSQAADHSGRHAARKGPRGSRRRSGRLQHGLPHRRRRLLRFLHLPRRPRRPSPSATCPAKACRASLMMMALQARVHVLAEDPGNLAHFMTRINKATCAKCPSNRFITFFFSVFNATTGDLAYANAGHNPPIIVRANGDAEMLDRRRPRPRHSRHRALQRNARPTETRRHAGAL